MKTEQEQIKKMARSMCGYCSTDGKCAVSKNGREPDICANVDTEHCLYKEYAERLIESGYGDVSEYKAEIQRLKAENETYCKQINQAYDTGYNDSCQDDIKQAKIDVLNRVMTYINNKIENDYGDMSDSVNYLTIDIDDFDDFIDELIKEVQND